MNGAGSLQQRPATVHVDSSMSRASRKNKKTQEAHHHAHHYPVVVTRSGLAVLDRTRPPSRLGSPQKIIELGGGGSSSSPSVPPIGGTGKGSSAGGGSRSNDSRHDPFHHSEDVHPRPWKTNISSNRHLTFSSPSNNHIVNQQDIPSSFDWRHAHLKHLT